MFKIALSVILAGLVLAGCGSKTEAVGPDRVLSEFRTAGLEVGATNTMTNDDYGLAPRIAEKGTRFLIPSLGDDSGGRVFIFSNADDLRKLESYYAEFGKASAALFSWTFANTDKLVLVQINGALPDSKARHYGRVVSAL